MGRIVTRMADQDCTTTEAVPEVAASEEAGARDRSTSLGWDSSALLSPRNMKLYAQPKKRQTKGDEGKEEEVVHRQTRESARSTRYGVPWEDENVVDTCEQCNTGFTFFTRKHHCRFCGCVVCADCNSTTVMHPVTETFEQKCDRCVHKTTAQRVEFERKRRKSQVNIRSSGSTSFPAGAGSSEQLPSPVSNKTVSEQPASAIEKPVFALLQDKYVSLCNVGPEHRAWIERNWIFVEETLAQKLEEMVLNNPEIGRSRSPRSCSPRGAAQAEDSSPVVDSVVDELAAMNVMESTNPSEEPETTQQAAPAPAPAPEVSIGGSPNFEMRDDKRNEMNEIAIEVLAGPDGIHAKLEYLCALQGRIFNLNNTVPADLSSQMVEALSGLILAAKQSIDSEPNRSMAQYMLDVGGPEAAHGLMNCSGLAGGWLFNNVLSDEAKAAVLDVHAQQWGGGGETSDTSARIRSRRVMGCRPAHLWFIS